MSGPQGIGAIAPEPEHLNQVDPTLNQAQRFVLSVRTNATATFNAADRLRFKSMFTFYTSTILSLGLILIPLLQLAEVKVLFNDRVLNSMTIFLAVSVLVYSVIHGTAHYEMRGAQIQESGNKVKALAKEVQWEMSYAGDRGLTLEQLNQYHHRYLDLITDVETHNRNDYRRTLLDMPDDYRLPGFKRLTENLKYYLLRSWELVPHLVLVVIETIFISDMLGHTRLLGYLLR